MCSGLRSSHSEWIKMGVLSDEFLDTVDIYPRTAAAAFFVVSQFCILIVFRGRRCCCCLQLRLFQSSPEWRRPQSCRCARAHQGVSSTSKDCRGTSLRDSSMVCIFGASWFVVGDYHLAGCSKIFCRPEEMSDYARLLLWKGLFFGLDIVKVYIVDSS